MTGRSASVLSNFWINPSLLLLPGACQQVLPELAGVRMDPTPSQTCGASNRTSQIVGDTAVQFHRRSYHAGG